MEWADWAKVAIAALTLLGSVICAAVLLTWRVSQLAAQLRKEIGDKTKAIDMQQVATADQMRRDFGELVRAALAKIHDFELWSRDTFVRRESFLNVTGEVKASIREQGNQTNRRLDDVNAKLDSLISRFIKPDGAH